MKFAPDFSYSATNILRLDSCSLFTSTCETNASDVTAQDLQRSDGELLRKKSSHFNSGLSSDSSLTNPDSLKETIEK